MCPSHGVWGWLDSFACRFGVNKHNAMRDYQVDVVGRTTADRANVPLLLYSSKAV